MDELSSLLGPTCEAILDSPAEERFDRLTRLARRCFSVPVSLLTLVTPDRQWFKSAQGTTLTESPVEISFCVHALRAGQALVLNKLDQDERFCEFPIVCGEPHLRFYAGVPLRAPEGKLVGTLCILDQKSREFSETDLAALQDLAACAETELRASSWSSSEQALWEESDSQQRRSLVDPLTRSWSAEAILDILRRESLRSSEHGRPLMVLLLETEVARAKAEELRRQLAPYQALGRLAENQFLMVLAEANSERAAALAANLLSQTGGRACLLEPPAPHLAPAQVRKLLQQKLSASSSRPLSVSVEQPKVRVHSFGPFEVWVGNEQVPAGRFKSQKVRMLLAYLLGSRDLRCNEEVLMDEFWPQGGDSARKSLRGALSTLRTILRPEGCTLDPLERRAGFVIMPREFPLWSDVVEFRSVGADSLEEGDLKRALSLYRGPYLEGGFEDWILRRRDQFHEDYLRFACRQANMAFARGDFEESARAAEGVGEEGWERQDLVAVLFRSWLRLGRPEQVVRRFREVKNCLQNDFGVEPRLELLELYHRAELALS
ncbi:MAG: GAF domain-containing protein [Candidatus Eremiobacteraeota bacterium]|nr:GAF domain-containing protein [Candidatus Eremiobacteraeota bacterium]